MNGNALFLLRFFGVFGKNAVKAASPSLIGGDIFIMLQKAEAGHAAVGRNPVAVFGFIAYGGMGTARDNEFAAAEIKYSGVAVIEIMIVYNNGQRIGFSAVAALIQHGLTERIDVAHATAGADDINHAAFINASRGPGLEIEERVRNSRY